MTPSLSLTTPQRPTARSSSREVKPDPDWMRVWDGVAADTGDSGILCRVPARPESGTG